MAIEAEYWVVDDEGALVQPDSLTEVSAHTEEEFVEPLFELKTPPCASVADLQASFLDQLRSVLERADELDKHLVPLGTPVDGAYVRELEDERTRIQREVLGRNFDYAKYCAGTHVHFEKRNVTDQLNVLLALDPALALLNSSPYFQGERIANGARAFLYRKMGYADYPGHGQLWDYVETVAEWERRLDHRYEEFEAAAVKAGVDPDAVAANFSPSDVVWTPVRLREAMPTVEWRSPDAALPSQVLRLVAELASVMETLHDTNVRIEGATGEVTDDGVTLPEFDSLSAYAHAAIVEGLASNDVAAYLDRMGLDVRRYDPIAGRMDCGETVTASEAGDLRRRYAELLREDVAAFAGAPT